MFPRVLLKDENWMMTLDWLGMGKLEVSHLPTQQYAVASKQMKSLFLSTMTAISDFGIKLTPGNPVVTKAFTIFAAMIIQPNDLRTRAAVFGGPRSIAIEILTED